MTVGLACYAIWRLVRAGIGHGTEDEDSGPERVAGVVSGLAYLTVCLTAMKIRGKHQWWIEYRKI